MILHKKREIQTLAEMEGERESQVIPSSNHVELNHENCGSDSKEGCSQEYSSSFRESENISNGSTQCNIAADEKPSSEQSPKLLLMKRFSGWMSELENKENRSGSVRCGTSQAIVSTCHSDLQNSQYTTNVTENSSEEDVSPQTEVPNDDSEIVRKAKEEGVVDVVFLGYVTKEACCKFVCEILKCVLYQRQQLPMTYDQLKYHLKQHQAGTQEGDIVGWRPPRTTGGLDWRKYQRTLQDLDEVLSNLEVLFSLTLVPRVLVVLGGSLVLPKELYEINMEEVALSAGEGCLRASMCLRKLFRTLFVADILTDARPVHLLTTTVMALGHRDCGVPGFRPKLDFKVPTRIKRQVIRLACEPHLTVVAQSSNSTDWGDYIWFQAPITIKGFCK